MFNFITKYFEKRRQYKKDSIELFFLKHKIHELGSWCSYYSPEIGHATKYLLGEQIYPQNIVSFRDSLTFKELTFESYVEEDHKLHVVNKFEDGQKGFPCCRCGFYETSHYKLSLGYSDGGRVACVKFEDGVVDE